MVVSIDGMDVDEVRGIAADLATQAETLHRIILYVDSLVLKSAQVWRGRDSERFSGWWRSEHRLGLANAEESLRGLGRSAHNNAVEQGNASGISGTSSGPNTALSPTVDPSIAHTQNSAPSAVQGPQAYRVDDAIAKATAEVGTTRPVGWNQPGECIKSVQRWINDAGGSFGGGGVVSGYQNSGAVEVGIDSIVKGDVVQYTSTSNPNEFVGGVHTVMIVGVNGDGTYHIVQSNSGSAGLVTEVKNWTPSPPAGLESRVWRFGQH